MGQKKTTSNKHVNKIVRGIRVRNIKNVTRIIRKRQ